MKNHVQLRKVLLGGAAVGLFLAPAFAQQIETVTVTGLRASLQSAQTIKQNADQVVDSITAVDIGALPDRNVADTLQRIPGVTLVRTDENRDPVRYGGTGSTVFIRGLSWTQSLTNGRDVFSAKDGRGLSFGDVSANLLMGVDVYKNPTAKMIEGGVGGTVDLRTRKPFDADDLLIAAAGDYTWAMFNKRWTPSVNALISDRWNTGIGEIGVLFSVDYQDQRNRVNAISKAEYYCVDFDGVAADGTVLTGKGQAACDAESLNDASGHQQKGYVPGALGPRRVDWQQQRFATDLVLQWRPNEKLEFTLEALNATANMNDIEHTMLFYPDNGNSANTALGYTWNSEGTWEGGKFANAWTQFDTRAGKHHNRTTDISLNAKYTPIDSLTITADVNFVESLATNYSMTGFTNVNVPGISFDFSGENPVMTQTAAPDLTITDYGIDAYMDHLEYNVAHGYSYRTDATWSNPDKGAWIRSVSAGFRGQNKLSILRQTGYGWRNMWWGPMPNQEKVLEAFDFGGLLGNTGLKAIMFKPSALNYSEAATKALAVSTLGVDPGFYASSLASCGDQDVYCIDAYKGLVPAGDNQNAGINPIKESVLSGYAMVDFGHDTFLGFDVPVDGNIGVRIVNTHDEIAPGKLTMSAPTVICQVGVNGVPAGGCNDVIAAQNYIGTGSTTQVLPAVTNDYTDVLPSFNFRAHLTDQLQARVAYSQAIVRPNFDYMYDYESVGFNFQTLGSPLEGTFKPGVLGATGSAGNPYIKPMHAQQYDASLEWYFSPSGSVSFGLFHKDLSNYFYTTTEARAITNPATSQTRTFYVTTTVNGGKGKVEGFEFAYQQFYDSLPGVLSGLGLQANYTKIYNSGGKNPTVNLWEAEQVANPNGHALPLEGMSNDSYNIALLYAKYDIDFRLAYNWRSTFLLTSSAANVKQPEWQRNYGQLDGSIFYSFMDHYKVGVQMTNILNTVTRIDVGFPDTAVGVRPYDWLVIDQKISFMVRANW